MQDSVGTSSRAVTSRGHTGAPGHRLQSHTGVKETPPDLRGHPCESLTCREGQVPGATPRVPPVSAPTHLYLISCFWAPSLWAPPAGKAGFAPCTLYPAPRAPAPHTPAPCAPCPCTPCPMPRAPASPDPAPRAPHPALYFCRTQSPLLSNQMRCWLDWLWTRVPNRLDQRPDKALREGWRLGRGAHCSGPVLRAQRCSRLGVLRRVLTARGARVSFHYQ